MVNCCMLPCMLEILGGIKIVYQIIILTLVGSSLLVFLSLFIRLEYLCAPFEGGSYWMLFSCLMGEY
jgi:hypothetical protein